MRIYVHMWCHTSHLRTMLRKPLVTLNDSCVTLAGRLWAMPLSYVINIEPSRHNIILCLFPYAGDELTGKVRANLQDILQFLTGIRVVPPLGMTKRYTSTSTLIQLRFCLKQVHASICSTCLGAWNLKRLSTSPSIRRSFSPLTTLDKSNLLHLNLSHLPHYICLSGSYNLSLFCVLIHILFIWLI